MNIRSAAQKMKILKWYFYRLRVMSFKEIIFIRLYRYLRNKFLKQHYTSPPNIKFDIHSFDTKYKNYFLSNFPETKTKILKNANKILENTFCFFSKEISLGEEIDWQQDYITGEIWPCKKIDYITTQLGDPKYIWELNRFQFLPELGKAYFLSGKDKYAIKAINLIEQWIDQNPPFQGINWAIGIEISIRLISWAWTLRFIGDSKLLSERCRNRIYKSMYNQIQYIIRNLSFGTSAGNHLISELAAMVFMGKHLAQEKWLTKSSKHLEEQIFLQILSDGVGAEQSLSYQAHTMEYYIISLLELRENGKPISEKILGRLKKGAVFFQSLIDTEGNLPNIGDNDSGEILKLSSDYKNNKTLLNLIAFLTGERNFKQPDFHQDEKCFWLLGPDIFSKLVNNSRSVNKRKRMAFPEGGYYIFEDKMNNKLIKLIFDCGPIGMKPLAGHGHCDALSFLLYVDEMPVLIDPSTYSYSNNDLWRDYFRGSTAHNIIRIDQKDQALLQGSFLPVKIGDSECLEWIPGKSVSGQFYGYKIKGKRDNNKRQIIFDKTNNTIIVEDQINFKGLHFIEQFFHFGVDCKISAKGDNFFSINTGFGEIIIQLDKKLKLKLYYGDYSVPQGWISRVYGSKEKSFALVGKTEMMNYISITTNILI